MAIDTDVYNALASISMLAGNVYQDTFPQPEDGPPVWPAIRFSVRGVPVLDVCGDDPETDESVASVEVFAETRVDRETLVLLVRTAMQTLPCDCTLCLRDFDSESKVYRAVLDFALHPSSV